MYNEKCFLLIINVFFLFCFSFRNQLKKWRSLTRLSARITRRPLRKPRGSSEVSLPRRTALRSCSVSRAFSPQIYVSTFNLASMHVWDWFGFVVQVALGWYFWCEDQDWRSIRNNEARCWASTRSQQRSGHCREAFGANQGAVPYPFLRRLLSGIVMFLPAALLTFDGKDVDRF